MKVTDIIDEEKEAKNWSSWNAHAQVTGVWKGAVEIDKLLANSEVTMYQASRWVSGKGQHEIQTMLMEGNTY